MLTAFHNVPRGAYLRPTQRLFGQASSQKTPVLNSFQLVAALLFLPADLVGPHLRKKTIQKLQTLSSLKYATNPCHSRPSLFPPLRLKRTVQIHPCPLALPSFISLHHCLSISGNHIGRLPLLSLVTDSGFSFGCQVVVWDTK